MMKDIEVRIASNWVNAFNFVVFDVVPISLVFYLTSDVMGRLNDSTLRDGEPRHLIIACPPVLGGGLCTTHRWRAMLLLFARLIGLGLILLTNLNIKGEERRETYRTMETVMTSGNVSQFTKDQFLNAMVGRAGCQGSRLADPAKNEGNGSIVFYGELRGENSDECITNRTLMSATPVEFGPEIIVRNISTIEPGETCSSRTRTMRNNTVAEFFCSRAVFFCHTTPPTMQPNFNFCQGLVRHENETYICEQSAAYPGMELQPTDVRWVRGLDYRSEEWLDAFFAVSTAMMKDVIDVSFTAGRERRMVQAEREVQWTLVRPLWFVALASKVALVALLAFTSISLKRAGFRAVAHDEQRLAELLGTELQGRVLPRGQIAMQEDADVFLNAAKSADGLLVYADSQPRRPPTAATVLQAGQGRRRNSELHRVEEMHI